MDNFILPEMSQFNVTCHTIDCENRDITICVPAVLELPIVICGACSNKIEDVIEVG